jgi:hypothetical protein
MLNVPRGRLPLEDIPLHYGGSKVTLADMQWAHVVELVQERLNDVLIEFEDAFGELMQAAFEYGTHCQPGDRPLLNYNYVTDGYEAPMSRDLP